MSNFAADVKETFALVAIVRMVGATYVTMKIFAVDVRCSKNVKIAIRTFAVIVLR